MYKVISILLLMCCGFSLMAVQNKDNGYKLNQQSKNSIYQSSLECNKKLTTGSFQSCSLKILNKGKIVKKAKIHLSGGMPAHQHGLPTTPKLVWSEEKQIYLIKGLKFSMPGEWVLNFKVSTDNHKDIVSMAINVN